MAEITIADVVDEAVTWGLPTRRAQRTFAQTVRDLQVALESIDRRAHPGVPSAWVSATSGRQGQ